MIYSNKLFENQLFADLGGKSDVIVRAEPPPGHRRTDHSIIDPDYGYIISST